MLLEKKVFFFMGFVFFNNNSKTRAFRSKCEKYNDNYFRQKNDYLYIAILIVIDKLTI